MAGKRRVDLPSAKMPVVPQKNDRTACRPQSAEPTFWSIGIYAPITLTASPAKRLKLWQLRTADWVEGTTSAANKPIDLAACGELAFGIMQIQSKRQKGEAELACKRDTRCGQPSAPWVHRPVQLLWTLLLSMLMPPVASG